MKKILALIIVAAVAVAGVLYYTEQRYAQPQYLANSILAERNGAPVRVAIINYLRILEGPVQGLKQGMTALGYTEGKNILYTEYYGDGDMNKMVAEAKQVIQNRSADVIVGNPGEGAQAALQAAEELHSNIPVLYMLSYDPIKMGLIKSFQSSGNQVTGVAVDLGALTSKRLEFLRQIAPNAKKIGIIIDPEALDLTATEGRDQLLAQAPKFGFTVVQYMVHIPPPATAASDAAITAIAKRIKPGEIDAFYRMLGPVTSTPGTIAAYAAMVQRLKIPSEFWGIERGSLFNYDNDYADAGVQLASLLDKVLKGTPPSDIPSENASKFTLQIDLGVAKQIGLTVPDSMLSIATQIYKAQ